MPTLRLRTLLENKEGWISVIFAALLFVDDPYFVGSFVLGLLSLVLVLLQLSRFALSLRLLLVYLVGSSLFHVVTSGGIFSATISRGIDFVILKTISIITLTSWLVEKTANRKPGKLLGVLCLGLSGLTIFSYLLGLPTPLQNTSINAGVIAFLIPFLFRTKWWPIAIAAIFTQRGMTAFGMLVVSGASWILLQGTKLRRWLFYGSAIVAPLTIYAYQKGWMSTTGRWPVYEIGLSTYWNLCNPMIGCGVDSILAIGPKLFQGIVGDAVWLNMHSDWLQALCETGIVGFVLLLVTFFDAIRRTYLSRPELCCAIISAGCFGIFYYPMRVPAIALVISYLMGCACLGKHEYRT